MMGFGDGSGISWTTCKQSAPRSRQVTTPTPHLSIVTGRLLFLTPNQRCQSTEGKYFISGNTVHMKDKNKKYRVAQKSVKYIIYTNIC